ncbi:hypothetical protein DFH07DRAFT_968566 [Mycena maculata]|uniref:RING-type domain-containing protein n=1 Tax=Mycena maculata TaxID=230809 RepID=A0AAD7I0L1_9AGAR|nr:hypothetical protein DFH07DRAFT_968566 [Mycena maculata]
MSVRVGLRDNPNQASWGYPPGSASNPMTVIDNSPPRPPKREQIHMDDRGPHPRIIYRPPSTILQHPPKFGDDSAMRVVNNSPPRPPKREQICMDDRGPRARIIYGPSTIIQLGPPAPTIGTSSSAAGDQNHSVLAVATRKHEHAMVRIPSHGASKAAAEAAKRALRRAELRAQAERPPLRRRPPPPPSWVSSGSHEDRGPRRLTHEDLWVNGIGPNSSEDLKLKPHHICGICHAVKSHPVTYVHFSYHYGTRELTWAFRYLCGHSHCYVCIRLWLEKRWSCPECYAQMTCTPFRQYAEEAGIAAEYPDWEDGSVVAYRWDGLTFPQSVRRIVPDSP